jgi:hypothetical protein
MENKTIDIDDESSEYEESVLNSKNLDYESEIENEINDGDKELFDTLDDEIIVLEISLTPEDFNLLKENKIIIGEGEECILILNDLINNCRDKNDESYNINIINKDKLKFIYGFIMGLIYSKHIKD